MNYEFNKRKRNNKMETMLVLLFSIGVLTLLYIFGKQTLIDWSNDDSYNPTFKEVILFIILFMIAQKSISNSIKNHNKN